MANIATHIRTKTKSGIVTKLLVQFNEHESAEVSLIERPDKNIICFSCMIGCPVGCNFCVSGVLDRYVRKLTVTEMVESIFLVKGMAAHPMNRWVISAMGEGEPALNAEAVIETFSNVNMMFDRCTFALSTSAPNQTSFDNLLHCIFPVDLPIKLQYSLHSDRHKLYRSSHLSAEYVLRTLTPTLRQLFHVELNITLIKEVNDSPEAFTDVKNLLSGRKAPWYIKLNRFNASPEIPNYTCADWESYMALKDLLKSEGHTVEYYETDGSDIAAACGQLRANVNKVRGAKSRIDRLREVNGLSSTAEVS